MVPHCTDHCLTMSPKGTRQVCSGRVYAALPIFLQPLRQQQSYAGAPRLSFLGLLVLCRGYSDATAGDAAGNPFSAPPCTLPGSTQELTSMRQWELMDRCSSFMAPKGGSEMHFTRLLRLSHTLEHWSLAIVAPTYASLSCFSLRCFPPPVTCSCFLSLPKEIICTFALPLALGELTRQNHQQDVCPACTLGRKQEARLDGSHR